MEQVKAKIQSMQRAVQILDYLASRRNGERLTVIAKDLKLNKSTAFGIVSTLEVLGLLKQDDESQRYLLGPRLITYGAAARSNLPLLSVAERHLTDFCQKYNETVHISILSGTEAVLVDKVESSRTVQISTRIGDRCPLTCCASGKVLLAFLPEKKAKQILDSCSFQRFTQNTITSRAMFESVLQQTRDQMYALDMEESESGRCCISSPILNSEGNAVAAISVSYPTDRALHTNPEAIKAIIQTARDISEKMGYHTP